MAVVVDRLEDVLVRRRDVFETPSSAPVSAFTAITALAVSVKIMRTAWYSPSDGDA